MERGSWRAENLPDDGVRELQTLQAQVLQKPAATDDALQSRSGDDGVGQIHLNQLQWAEQWKRYKKDNNIIFFSILISEEDNYWTLWHRGRRYVRLWHTQYLLIDKFSWNERLIWKNLCTELHQLLDSPCACEVQLFHEGARAAQPADSSLQHLLQGLIYVGQPLQIHTAPQSLIKPGADTQAGGEAVRFICKVSNSLKQIYLHWLVQGCIATCNHFFLLTWKKSDYYRKQKSCDITVATALLEFELYFKSFGSYKSIKNKN